MIRTAEARGLWLGLVGVTVFALTLPMTRLAVGTPEAPQLSGVFVAFGRAAVAALLSAALLLVQRAPLPRRDELLPLAITSAGVVLGFPLLTSIALRHVQAAHASVVIGALPLATAVVGAWIGRQRPSPGFWLCAGLGCALVVAFTLLRTGAAAAASGSASSGALSLHGADLLLLAAVACAAVGYAWGARLSQRMPAEHVICWALLLALPGTLPATLWAWPSTPVAPSAWSAFGYVSVFSMWLGFFAWYRGLALGGTVRVSQVQLLQPFMAMLFAVPLLGERLDALTVGFALAVAGTVVIGRKMPVHRLSTRNTA